MGSETTWNDVESLNQPSGDQKNAACAASQRLSENIVGIAKGNSDINYEMNNGRVECYPPPITPRCRFEEIPPNPAIVDNRVSDMIKREQAMQADLGLLSPLVADDPKLSKRLDELNNSVMTLATETSKLYDMTANHSYDEGAIDKENRVIEKMTKQVAQNRKALSRDLGCDSNDLQNTSIGQEHQTVSCDVAMKPKDVWKQIGKFDALSWHPGIKSGTVEGDIRTLQTVDDGPQFTEQLIGTGEDRKTGTRYYTYKMTDGLPVQPITTLKVEPHGKGSRITWTAAMDLSNLDDKTAQGVEMGMRGFFLQGLGALPERLKK